MNLSPAEKAQYDRHLILDQIGLDGQQKLKAAKVLVIGAGGLGCPVLQYLSAAGVGTIGILDDDVVDSSNLQRQVLYNHDDLGKSKAETAAKKLARSNPYIQLNVHAERLNSANALQYFEAYDIIVDGSDNFPTRYLVNDAAVLSDKPLVFGSIFKFDGQVSVLNYQGGPTYRCLFPTPPEPNAVPNCSEIGVLGVLPGLVGCLQANEVIKMIVGIGEVLRGKLLLISALNLEFKTFQFAKNEAIHIEKLEESYADFCGIPDLEEIGLANLETLGINYSLLDVRTDAERLERHIGGIHIPLDELEGRIAEIPEGTVVVYCRSGRRSVSAIQLMKEKGIKQHLINLKGGIQE